MFRFGIFGEIYRALLKGTVAMARGDLPRSQPFMRTISFSVCSSLLFILSLSVYTYKSSFWLFILISIPSFTFCQCFSDFSFFCLSVEFYWSYQVQELTLVCSKRFAYFSFFSEGLNFEKKSIENVFYLFCFWAIFIWDFCILILFYHYHNNDQHQHWTVCCSINR
jgi:hypothetical protein